jgi:CubicO group peptidase (beta-lactamase class C family)
MSRHKQTARLQARAEQDLRDAMWAAEPEFDDADAYGFNPPASPAVRAEAARQWDAIPNTPAEIAVWMRGEPIGGAA